jgi:plastocyanin
MKKILLFAIIMALTVGVGFAAKYTITNVGFTFSPDTLIIEAGEDVEFSLGLDHNAVEVTQETWDADGNTPKSGGFSVPFGGDEVVFPNAGTYYYVCEPHASAGMKGVIIVSEATAISTVSNDISTFNVFPNPASDFITFSYTLDSRAIVKILLINSAGVEVANILKGTLDPGQYKNTYSLNKDLAPGIYYVSFVSGNQSNINKMVIK